MLYKYLSASRVSVLDSLEVRFSQPRALNDPFEASPLIDTTAYREALIKKFEVEAEDLWANTSNEEKTQENYQLLQKQLETLRADVCEMASPSNVGIELMDMLNPCLGVLSLSKNFSNLLMWSHYADSHKWEYGVRT